MFACQAKCRRFESDYPLHNNMKMKLDPVHLHQSCQPADYTNSLKNLRLAQHMVQLMLDQHGIGLAANQVGVNLRLFVMFVDREIFHCFNPEIIEASREIITSREGCLSFPGEECRVPRHSRILAEFANASGHGQQREFTGLAARCFQHELDHLNGVTMHERSSSVTV